jgi:hypothetical protein
MRDITTESFTSALQRMRHSQCVLPGFAKCLVVQFELYCPVCLRCRAHCRLILHAWPLDKRKLLTAKQTRHCGTSRQPCAKSKDPAMCLRSSLSDVAVSIACPWGGVFVLCPTGSHHSRPWRQPNPTLLVPFRHRIYQVLNRGAGKYEHAIMGRTEWFSEGWLVWRWQFPERV